MYQVRVGVKLSRVQKGKIATQKLHYEWIFFPVNNNPSKCFYQNAELNPSMERMERWICPQEGCIPKCFWLRNKYKDILFGWIRRPFQNSENIVKMHANHKLELPIVKKFGATGNLKHHSSKPKLRKKILLKNIHIFSHAQ